MSDDLLSTIEKLLAKLPPRGETVGVVVIVPDWEGDRVLVVDGPQHEATIRGLCWGYASEAWEVVRRYAEWRVIIAGPALERHLGKMPKSDPATVAGGWAGAFGVPVVRLSQPEPLGGWQ